MELHSWEHHKACLKHQRWCPTWWFVTVCYGIGGSSPSFRARPGHSALKLCHKMIWTTFQKNGGILSLVEYWNLFSMAYPSVIKDSNTTCPLSDDAPMKLSIGNESSVATFRDQREVSWLLWWKGYKPPSTVINGVHSVSQVDQCNKMEYPIGTFP